MFISFDQKVNMFDFDFKFDRTNLVYFEHSEDPVYDYDYLAYDNQDGSQIRLSGEILPRDDGGYYGEIGFVSYNDKDHNRVMSIYLSPGEDLEQFVFGFGNGFKDYISRHGDETISITGSREDDILTIPYGYDGVLAGEEGNDEYWGGGGDTVFFFRRKFGKDIIHDFQPDRDYLDLTHFYSSTNKNYWGKMKNEWSKTRGDDTILKLEKSKIILLDIEFKDLSKNDFYFY